MSSTDQIAIGELEVGDWIVLFGNAKRRISRFGVFEDDVVVIYEDGPEGEKSLRPLRVDERIPAIRGRDYVPGASPAARNDQDPVEPVPEADPETAGGAYDWNAVIVELVRRHGPITDRELYDRHRDEMLERRWPPRSFYHVERVRRTLAGDGTIRVGEPVRNVATGDLEQTWLYVEPVALTLESEYDPEPDF